MTPRERYRQQLARRDIETLIQTALNSELKLIARFFVANLPDDVDACDVADALHRIRGELLLKQGEAALTEARELSQQYQSARTTHDRNTLYRRAQSKEREAVRLRDRGLAEAHPKHDRYAPPASWRPPQREEFGDADPSDTAP